MYKLGFNHTPKSFSIISVKGRILCGLILILFCFFSTKSLFGQVTDTSQLQNTPHKTFREKIVFKIEYFIDGQPVTNSETISTLQKMTHISVGSQFSRYAIQQSVISLYSLKKFSEVDVYTLETVNGIVLKFDLTNMMRIQKIKDTGVLTGELRNAIRDVIKLKPGEIYSPEIAKNDADSIKAVCADNGYFNADVEVKVITTDESLIYQIDLRDPTLVSEVQIQGNTAIFSERIKEICQTRVGKVYRKSTVDEDIAAIQDLYRKKYYYPSTEIEFSFKHETGILTLDINEGVQLLLDFVDENGKPIFQDSLIRNFWAKLRNIRQESERDQLINKITDLINDDSRWVQTVETHFKARGYDGTKVDIEKLTNSPLHVKFTIKLGIRYVVRKVGFTGNKAFSQKELLREMETKPTNFFSQHIKKRFFSEQTLERDKKRLKILYEKSGYPKVTVKQDLLKQDANNRNVGEISINLTFVEPYREVIYRCHFSGNSVLDAVTLYEALPSKPPGPNARLVKKKYENAILKAYQDRGYIDATVETQYLDKTDKPVFLVEGNFSKLLDAFAIPKKIEDVFAEHNLSLTGIDIATKIGDEWSIQDAYGNARYTFKQEKEQLAVFEHGVLQFEIDEGSRVMFGNFNFVGDTGVKPYILNREVVHLPGTLFTLDRLNQSIQNMYNTGIFETGIRWNRKAQTSLGDQPSDFDENDTQILLLPETRVDDVVIRLQKRKPREYSADIDYSSTDDLRGTIAFSHRNLFKRNIRFHLRGRLSLLRWRTGNYLYDTILTEPWLIGRTSGSLQFMARKLEEDDYVRALQGSFSLSRKLSRAHRLNLQYSFRDLKDTFVDETAVASLIPNSSTTVSSLSFLWRQDSQFPALNPTSGMFNEVTIEYAGGFLGGKSSFIKVTGDTRYNKRLHTRGLVLATALRLGFTTGLQDNSGSELISFERFWAGGSTTVRGYEERGLGPHDLTGKHRGNIQFIFNTELRFPIFNPIRGVFFFDTGNVWGTVADIEYEWLPSALGVGLRLNLGPLELGVDYAAPLISIPDVPTNSFYFRIGNTF
ncbi:hypothetical protein C6501_01725 [Candidatus Poribacteria bacterium]|nr:MAG: hypothetical protein C6501_01725 [Candidatus Poribacteria bacterium]